MIWELLTNFGLIAPFIALVTSQILKLIYYYIKEGKLDFDHLTEAAGMPSSHAALVSSLAIAAGLLAGWHSPLFAVALIFSAVVMYDSAGVRQAAGKQAKILNQMIEDGEIRHARLTELLGHTPIEVMAGSLLGIAVTLMLYGMFFKWPVF